MIFSNELGEMLKCDIFALIESFLEIQPLQIIFKSHMLPRIIVLATIEEIKETNFL